MNNSIESNKDYLGDSVYVDTDGDGVILTTENGVPTDPSNKIFMDIGVIKAFIRYVKSNGMA